MGFRYMQSSPSLIYHKHLIGKGGSENFNILLCDFFKGHGTEFYLVVKNINHLWELELGARGIRFIRINSVLDLFFLCFRYRRSEWISSSGAFDLALIKLILWRLRFTFLEHECWVFEESNRILNQDVCRNIFEKFWGRDDWLKFSVFFPGDHYCRLFYWRKFAIVTLARTTQLLTNISLQEKKFVMPHGNYAVSCVAFGDLGKKKSVDRGQHKMSNHISVVWIGRNVPKKRLLETLEIFSSVVPRLGFKVVLHVISPSYIECSSTVISESNAKFYIGLDDRERTKLISHCDLMINSDVSDFVLTVVEALSLRVPCLVAEFFDVSVFPPDSPLVPFEFNADSLYSGIERSVELMNWNDLRWARWEEELLKKRKSIGE